MRDGWFFTGDLATRAPDGYWRIVGRRSTDLIKTGGYKVGAGEVEVALLEHPGVLEAAVTGEPDADLGERIVAWVVAEGDPRPAPKRADRPRGRRARAAQAPARDPLPRRAAPQRDGQGRQGVALAAADASIVRMIATVSSSGIRGLSSSPASMQRATSSASWRSPPSAGGSKKRCGSPLPRDQRERDGLVEGAVDLDPGVGADDRGARRADRPQRAVSTRVGAALVAEQDRGLGVDAGERGVGDRLHAVRRAQHHRRERHRVDAEVEQRAAAELGREQPVRRVLREPLAVVGDDRDDLAQRAVGEQPPDPRMCGRKRAHIASIRKTPRGRGLGDQRLGLGGVHRERLLDQHALPASQRQQRVRVVHRMGRGDVDDVDLRVRDERLVGVVPVGHAEALAERLGGLLPARADAATVPESVRSRSAANVEAIPPVPMMPQRITAIRHHEYQPHISGAITTMLMPHCMRRLNTCSRCSSGVLATVSALPQISSTVDHAIC